MCPLQHLELYGKDQAVTDDWDLLQQDLRWKVSEAECDIHESFDTNECPNIFVSTKLYEGILEYICINFFDTNECPNKYSY